MLAPSAFALADRLKLTVYTFAIRFSAPNPVLTESPFRITVDYQIHENYAIEFLRPNGMILAASTLVCTRGTRPFALWDTGGVFGAGESELVSQ
jgi:hypothetical protein